jgi:hypothetical protein
VQSFAGAATAGMLRAVADIPYRTVDKAMAEAVDLALFR